MVTNRSSIDIREIKECSELKAVEDLQKEIWGCSDREIFPSLALIPLLEIGGVLLGAFDGPDLIGFVLGFPGIEDGRLILHSDMLAVKSAYRSHGVGYRLKVAQRERARAKGIDKITWTFDPLQSLNAHLNFAKLGVIADKYKVNYYGETSSPLHRTGTDRLWVTWLLDSNNVHQRITGTKDHNLVWPDMESAPRLVRVGPDGEPLTDQKALNHLTTVIEIPDDINGLMAENPDLALRWRGATREAFATALAVGFLVEDFRWERESPPIGSYLLKARLNTEP
ncbi:MAG: GNAT family N-acetyltransferase [Pyrinomonadaceae bacterium]